MVDERRIHHQQPRQMTMFPFSHPVYPCITRRYHQGNSNVWVSEISSALFTIQLRSEESSGEMWEPQYTFWFLSFLTRIVYMSTWIRSNRRPSKIGLIIDDHCEVVPPSDVLTIGTAWIYPP